MEEAKAADAPAAAAAVPREHAQVYSAHATIAVFQGVDDANVARFEIARYLLDSRMGDVNAQNARGDTAMIEACRSGAHGVVELLIQHGASVSHSNKAGMTAFLEAAESGAYDVLEILLRQPNIDVTWT